jgi:hypothetical protein
MQYINQSRRYFLVLKLGEEKSASLVDLARFNRNSDSGLVIAVDLSVCM